MGNGVHYISDQNDEAALLAVFQALANASEFCVVPQREHTNTHEHIALAGQAVTASTKTNSYRTAHIQCLTAGSSGSTKRVRRTQASWLASIESNQRQFELNTSDSYALLGKLSHSLPLYAAIEAAHIGADIHCLASSHPNAQLRAINRLGTSVIYATPSQLKLLCRAGENSMLNPPAVRYVFSGGGKLDAQTRKSLLITFPGALVFEFYGSAETSFITMSDKNTPIDSVGKLYSNVHIRFTDANGNSAINEGEIWVKSPYLFEGYIGNDAHDATWCDGYVSVGEIGTMDATGNLYLIGRKSRMTKVLDVKVFPEAIEAFLLTQSEVNNCAVVPAPDNKRGAILIAIIEAQYSKALEHTLLLRLRKHFGETVAPRTLLFTEQLPLLESGKPDLHAISNKVENECR